MSTAGECIRKTGMGAEAESENDDPRNDCRRFRKAADGLVQARKSAASLNLWQSLLNLTLVTSRITRRRPADDFLERSGENEGVGVAHDLGDAFDRPIRA